MPRAACFLLPLLLAACGHTQDWATHTGKYIPLVGERCQNWQCMQMDDVDDRTYTYPTSGPAPADSQDRKSFPSAPAQ